MQAQESAKRQSSLVRTSVLRYMLVGILYCASYWLLDQISNTIQTENNFSPWYPPAGLTLLLMMIGGRKYWPWTLIAALIIEIFMTQVTFVSAVLFALLIAITYGGTGVLLREWLEVHPRLRRLSDVVWFMILGIILAPFMTAVFGVAILTYLNNWPPHTFQINIMTFWIGDAIGIASFVPTILVYQYLLNRRQVAWIRQRMQTIGLEVYLQTSVLLITVAISFFLADSGSINSFYLTGVPLLWIAMRAGFPRSALGVTVISLTTIMGLYLNWATKITILDLQLFVLTVSLSGLLVGAITSERQRVEQKLYTSEQYFRSLITFSSDLISIINKEGVIQYESPSVRRVLGYSEGLIGHNIFTYVHPDDSKHIQDIYQQSLDGDGISPTVQYRIRHADGSWRWIESVANNIDHRELINGLIVNSRDITDRRKAQEYIRLQTDLLNQVNNAVVVVDPELTIILWNRAAEILFGWSAHEVTGKSLLELDLIPARRLHGAIDIIRAMLEYGKSAQGEITIVARNKAERPIYLATTPFRDEQHMIKGIIGIGNDITDRKLTEQRLIESEQYFRSLIENASDLISIIDEHGIIHYHSPSIERVLGYSSGLVGKNAFDFVHVDDRNALQAVLRRKLSHNAIGSPVHYRYRHYDGSWRIIETVSNILNPDATTNLRIVLNSRDITERKQLEEAITLIAQGVADTTGIMFYRSLVLQLSKTLQIDYAFIGLYDEDTETIKTLAVCAQGRQLPNYNYAVKDTPAERVIKGSRAVYQSNVQQFFPLDQHMYKLDIQAYLALPLDAPPQIKGILCVMHTHPIERVSLAISTLSIFAQRIMAELKRQADEESRLQMERNLMETQKLESLGLLAGGIAHDFNNVLMTIMGNVGLALLDLEEESIITPYLQTVETAARHAADLCRQMLAYSGKSQVLMTSIAINDLIQEMLHLLNVSIGKHVHMELHFAPDLPSIKGDVSQIRQVVMNLIVNAAEAIDPKQQGLIRIETGTQQLDSFDIEAASSMFDAHLTPGTFVFTEVKDNGSGMDVETLAKIFDPFFTTKFTGRGLGLAAVQGIVRSHHGILRVWSNLSEGSTFRILFPAESIIHTHVPPPLPEKQSLGEGTILVIDDKHSTLQTIVHMIRALGLNTFQASNGKAAIQIFHEHQASITGVLLDMTMPGITSEEVCQHIRDEDPALPIVIMSGYSQTEALERFAPYHVAGFLQKPYEMDNLHQLLLLMTKPIADSPHSISAHER